MGAGGASEWTNLPKDLKPHWSSWKIEGTPLEEVEKRLAAKGLRDPWLRNEVWKFQPAFSTFKRFRTGLTSGFVIFLGLYAVERVYFPERLHPHH